jgi:hypothetical protein
MYYCHYDTAVAADAATCDGGSSCILVHSFSKLPTADWGLNIVCIYVQIKMTVGISGYVMHLTRVLDLSEL